MPDLHLLLVIDSETKTVHLAGLDESPVDSDQDVWDGETQEWRGQSPEETDIIMEIEHDVVAALQAAGLAE